MNTNTPFRFVSCAALALSLASGCIINNPPPPPADGSITFAWSFAGERDCAVAGVDTVDVQVLADGGVVFAETVECFGGGLTLTDFSPDAYEVLLDAYSRSNRLLYQGEGFVQVQSGVENDMGTIELARVGGAAAAGSLALYWGFLYPTDDSMVISCEVAGVEAVRVSVFPLTSNTAVYDDWFACEDEGVIIDGLPEQEYDIVLEAEGTYQNQGIVLYDGLVPVTVRGGQVADLGDVPLMRVFESFADIKVTWDVAGGTCAQLDVEEVELVITRMNGDIEDDAVIVECDRTFALRETFVPGSYLVEAFATGADGEYYGSSTLDVAPDTTSEADVDLVLVP